jgi:hypothetical protein
MRLFHRFHPLCDLVRHQRGHRTPELLTLASLERPHTGNAPFHEALQLFSICINILSNSKHIFENIRKINLMAFLNNMQKIVFII